MRGLLSEVWLWTHPLSSPRLLRSVRLDWSQAILTKVKVLDRQPAYNGGFSRINVESAFHPRKTAVCVINRAHLTGHVAEDFAFIRIDADRANAPEVGGPVNASRPVPSWQGRITKEEPRVR